MEKLYKYMVSTAKSEETILLPDPEVPETVKILFDTI